MHLSPEALLDLFRTTFEHAPIGMCLLDSGGSIVLANRVLGQTYGYGPHDLAGKHLSLVTAPPEWDETREKFEALAAGKAEAYELKSRARRADGRVVDVLVSCSALRTPEGGLRYVIMHVRDLTAEVATAEALRESEAGHRGRLEQQARTDELTNLPNRRRLNEDLDALLDKSSPAARPAVLFLDLDNFKHINDMHGHSFGDEILQAVVERLLSVRPGEDTIARFGGDEFVVLAPNGDKIERIAAAYLQALSLPVTCRNRPIDVSLSVGAVSLDRSEPLSVDEVLSRADVALYRAKSGGKNRATVFTDAMRHELHAERQLETELRSALDREEVVCLFQPIVRLRGIHIESVETLVRWQHPRMGLLTPDKFLGIAERGGLIGDVDYRALRGALLRWKTWRDEGHLLRVSVNVATSQLGPAVVQRVGRVLAELDVPGEALCLEITEGALLDAETSGGVLRDLEDMGVRLAIDDFGTGYSCLAYLRDLPVHEVKIDRSFTSRMEDSATLKIVRGIVQLSHELGIEVVAEGIETAAQRDMLIELGCDLGQGYLFARPTADPLSTLVTRVRTSTRPRARMSMPPGE